MYTDRYIAPMDAEIGNRTVILEKALGLFAQRGYEAVGVAELCEASSITKPTLYHYFGSKRGLLDAILAEKGGILAARLKTAAVYAVGDRARGVPDGLEAMAGAFATTARESEAFARLRLTLAFAPPSSEGGEAAAALNEGVFSDVEAFFRAAAGDHGNMRGRSRPYAAAFIGTVDTYVGLYLAGRSPLSDEVVRGAVRQFMYGIFS
jgi:TetR/AcrR family transcriptional regulator